MTDQRSIERILDEWFADGPSVAPDRVLDVAANRIGRQRQRPAWRLLSWRDFPVITTSKLVAGLAAILVIAVIGIAVVLRPGGSNVGGQGPTASPSPVATPTPAPTPSPSSTVLKSGVTGPGTFTASERTPMPSSGFMQRILTSDMLAAATARHPIVFQSSRRIWQD